MMKRKWKSAPRRRMPPRLTLTPNAALSLGLGVLGGLGSGDAPEHGSRH